MGSERNERPQSASEMTPASRARSSGPSSGVPPVPTPAVLNEPVTGQKAAPAPNNAGSAKNSGPPEATGPVSRGPNPLRAAFGALLFVAWIMLTAVWLASTLYSVAHGNPIAAVTAFCALALLLVLGVMEGLEVAVIDCWQKIWPGRSTSYLARWLAARQLFVASIVTGATLLANRDVLVVPGTSVQTTDTFALGMFDLAWTTFTVLWFAQIMPKHLGAMNPDRYLKRLLRWLFPLVDVVRMVGVSLPGEWAAYVLEYWLAWPAQTRDEWQKMVQKHSLADIWCKLREDVEEVKPKP